MQNKKLHVEFGDVKCATIKPMRVTSSQLTAGLLATVQRTNDPLDAGKQVDFSGIKGKYLPNHIFMEAR